MIETLTGNNEFGSCIGCRLPYGNETSSGNSRTNALLVIAGESGVEISDIQVPAGGEVREQVLAFGEPQVRVPAGGKTREHILAFGEAQAQVPGSGKDHEQVSALREAHEPVPGEREIIIGVRV
ncbi:MAG: hypothetical protein GYA23_13235 [Methanomicrobiales archaeon]|nr:hypothetical protein [Methanomicrobiales archaeon]